jgi:hypothetical protein
MKFSRRRLRPRLPETGPQKFSAAFSVARPKGRALLYNLKIF